MAKKKNTSKKHKFKYVESSPISSVVETDGESTSAMATHASRAAVQIQAGVRDFSYVGRDVRRIGLMASGLVAVELLFYYLLVYTSVGPSIYRAIGF